jgi:hypothetical protein
MPSIKQAIKTSDTTFKVNDVAIEIINAPSDCDWSRWGMLDDRKSTRMYCFKKDTVNQLYQFLFDGKNYRYEENFILTIEGVGTDQNTDKIAMLSTPNFEEAVGIMDQGTVDPPYLPIPNNYHVYMQKAGKPQFLYQFILKAGTTNFAPNGITRDWFGINAFPDDTDWTRWTMTYDSNHYQLSLPAYVLYAFKEGSNNEIYFGRYGAVGDEEYTTDDGETKLYDVYSHDPKDHPEDEEGDQYYGQLKGGKIKVEGLTEDFKVTDLSMVFDGINTYLYLLEDESK